MKIMQLNALTYVGPQISATDIIELKRRGVSKIIVARPDGETDDQPAISEITFAANAVGIVVHQIPVVPGQITDEDVCAFEAFNTHIAGPVFAYCRSGMRATSLWALNQHKKGCSTEDNLRSAGAAGYDLTAMTPRLTIKPSTAA